MSPEDKDVLAKYRHHVNQAREHSVLAEQLRERALRAVKSEAIRMMHEHGFTLEQVLGDHRS